MKNLWIRLVLASLVLFVTFPAQAAETFVLDPSHSYIVWHVNHFGFSNPSGKWLADGTLVLDENNPADSKVDVTVKMANIVTGIPKFDAHLKTPDFFDVEKYPTARFVSDKVEVVNKDTAKVYGTLTVHGVSKPVVLDVKLNKIAVSPITNKKTAGFTGTTNLKRSDFDMSKYIPGVSDDVQIDIQVEAAKAS